MRVLRFERHWLIRDVKMDSIGDSVRRNKTQWVNPGRDLRLSMHLDQGPKYRKLLLLVKEAGPLFDLVLYLFDFQEANVELAVVKPRRIGLLEEITTNLDLHGAASLTSGRKNREQLWFG